MQPEIAKKLVRLNQEFYQTFGEAFSRTRQRIQPGTKRFLESAPAAGTWLDLGCGNGFLVRAWEKLGFTGAYIGLDFSNELLNEAKELSSDMVNVRFQQWDLSSEVFPHDAVPQVVDGVMAFAALHHLPGMDNRLRLLRNINARLHADGIFVHSEWQFQHSPRLMARVQPWSRVGVADEEVDAGDHLLDWRYAVPGQLEISGLRYVHIFNTDELRCLAMESRFDIVKEWYSDGQGGKLSLYQVWRKR